MQHCSTSLVKWYCNGKQAMQKRHMPWLSPHIAKLFQWQGKSERVRENDASWPDDLMCLELSILSEAMV